MFYDPEFVRNGFDRSIVFTNQPSRFTSQRHSHPRGHIDWHTKPCHPRRPAGPSPHWANAASRWYEAALQEAMQETFRIHPMPKEELGLQ